MSGERSEEEVHELRIFFSCWGPDQFFTVFTVRDLGFKKDRLLILTHLINMPYATK